MHRSEGNSGIATSVYSIGLNDDEWAVLAPLIPSAKPHGRSHRSAVRRIVNGIFYVLRTGCPSRYLPTNCPPWRTVLYLHLRQFRRKNTLHALYTALRSAEQERTRTSARQSSLLDALVSKARMLHQVHNVDPAQGQQQSIPVPLMCPPSQAASYWTYRCPQNVLYFARCREDIRTECQLLTTPDAHILHG